MAERALIDENTNQNTRNLIPSVAFTRRLRSTILIANIKCLDAILFSCLTIVLANPYVPPATVYPSSRKSPARSFSISAAASNGIGLRCA
jgi:hypothetical protein